MLYCEYSISNWLSLALILQNPLHLCMSLIFLRFFHSYLKTIPLVQKINFECTICEGVKFFNNHNFFFTGIYKASLLNKKQRQIHWINIKTGASHSYSALSPPFGIEGYISITLNLKSKTQHKNMFAHKSYKIRDWCGTWVAATGVLRHHMHGYPYPLHPGKYILPFPPP